MDQKEQHKNPPVKAPQLRTVAFLCIGILLLSLAPMLLLARYDYPAFDDFNWAADSRAVILKGESVLAHAVEVGREGFVSMYGNFICFFNALMPDIFAESAESNSYMWGAILIILLFTASAFVFLYTAARRLLKSSRASAAVAASLFALAAIQFLPSGVEAFYNYVLAVSYTLPFSLQLLLGAFAISLCCEAEGAPGADKWRSLALFAASAAAGLLTYLAPGLTVALMWVSIALWLIIARSRGRFVALFGALGACTAFLITLFSGGAQSRATADGFAAGPFTSIAYSVFFTGIYIGKWLCVPVLILLCLISAALWPNIKASGFSFKLPGLVSVVALGLCCSVSTPVVFARAGRGSGRIFNISYWFFLITLVFLTLYWLGWLNRKTGGKLALPEGLKPFKSALVLALCCVFVLSLAQLDRFDIFDSESPMEIEQRTTSLSAAWSLISGEAKAYAAEQTARREVLFDESIKNAVFEPIKTRPYLLFYRDLDCGAVTAYYGKASVLVESAESMAAVGEEAISAA